MSDPLSGGAAVENPKGTSPLANADHGIYRVEKTVAWTSLLVMAVGYFLSILDRELTAGPGQNAIERFVLKRLGQTIESADPAFLQSLHGLYAPIAGVIILLALILVAAATIRNPQAVKVPKRLQFALIAALSLGTIIGTVLFVPSNMVGAGLVLLGVAYTLWDAHKRQQLIQAAVFAIPLGAIGLWFCFTI